MQRVNDDLRFRPSVDGKGFAFPKGVHPEEPLPRSPSADGLLYESPAGIQSVSTAHVVQRKTLEMLSATQDGLYSPVGGLWHGVEAR